MFNYPGSPDPKIWATKKDLDAAFAKIKDLTSLVNILAKDVTFKVKFNAGTGGTGTMSDLTMTGLGTSTLPECTMTRTGHVFASWNTKSDGTGRTYADEASVSFLDFKDESGDVTLYAQWRPAVYDVVYSLDGGTNSPDNPATYTYGVGVSSFGDASKEGFEFTGWHDAGGDPVTSIGTTETGDVTVYAGFAPL